MSTPTDVSAARLLLCDDSAVERSALAQLLRFEGYRVDEAGDGEEAIDLLKTHNFDLVVLDLNMPQIDGFGVLGYVNEHRRAMPVVLLSGMTPNRIQHQIHKLPNQALPPLLLKPVDCEQMLTVIEMQLAGELPDWNGADDV